MSAPRSNVVAVQPIRLEDIEAFLEVCIDTLGRLAALMNAIQESSPADSDAARHADTGWHGACWMEGAARLILEQLQKGGVQR
jgi:hypothetical protein